MQICFIKNRIQNICIDRGRLWETWRSSFSKKYERMMWMGMLSVVKAFKVLPKIIVKNGHKFMFAVKKASPELLVAGGLVASTVGFIWAIVNARKLDSTLQETQSKVELIEAKRNDIADNDKPSIHEWEKELNKAKAESIWKVFYLMGLPAICFVGGIAMVGGGHLMLFRRFGAVSSAFAALQSKFTKYRQLNIAEHGEECDQRYGCWYSRYGAQWYCDQCSGYAAVLLQYYAA